MQRQRAPKKGRMGPENSHKASSCVGGAAFSIGRRPHAATAAIIQHKIMRFRGIRGVGSVNPFRIHGALFLLYANSLNEKIPLKGQIQHRI